jgi:hypothetical protein
VQDIVSEHPERFFVAEILREKIFLQYKQEVPYSCQVSPPPTPPPPAGTPMQAPGQRASCHSSSQRKKLTLSSGRSPGTEWECADARKALLGQEGSLLKRQRTKIRW